ncbi:MAG: hypothetical protein RQ847_06475 [Wenzhouxiangellaceae bacterium]|nr:hypothetical protein [Wenzhouxiangellaceae bacterium]
MCAPFHRLLVPMWPETIVERVYPDGRIVLVEADRRLFDDGFSRSRPLNAARLDLGGGFELGYVVSVRSGGQIALPPSDRVWQPDSDDCELGLRIPGEKVRWVPCQRIRRVVQPNRLTLVERVEVAFRRVLARHQEATAAPSIP